ncbi:MAG: rod shape-determining protein MreC [bacterium]|nr:rod shape-determining protein MreC [bacterium]
MRNRVKTTITIVLIVVVSLILLNTAGVLNPVKSIIDVTISNPVRLAFSEVAGSLSKSLGVITSIGSLNAKNTQLEVQVTELKNKLSELKEVKNENDILRAQLGFESRQPLKTIPARVISFEPDNIRKFLTLDKGSRHGLKKGMPVVSSGILVGTLDEVDSFSSKVFLINDPEFRIRAIGQDGRASGIVRGQLGQGLLMEKIAQNEIINLNEFVITAGSDDVPKGILIGQVEGIVRNDNAIFQSADLKSLINPSKLELVFVVTEK